MLSDNSNNELPVLEPNTVEKVMIKQLQDLYPTLDYLMCLTLVKSSEKELQKVADELPKQIVYMPDTSSLIKGGITVD